MDLNTFDIDVETRCEIERAFFSQARADATELGQRYVPAQSLFGATYSGTKGHWCVVDTEREEIVSSGLAFGPAHRMAGELSDQDRRRTKTGAAKNL